MDDSSCMGDHYDIYDYYGIGDHYGICDHYDIYEHEQPNVHAPIDATTGFAVADKSDLELVGGGRWGVCSFVVLEFGICSLGVCSFGVWILEFAVWCFCYHFARSFLQGGTHAHFKIAFV